MIFEFLKENFQKTNNNKIGKQYLRAKDGRISFRTFKRSNIRTSKHSNIRKFRTPSIGFDFQPKQQQHSNRIKKKIERNSSIKISRYEFLENVKSIDKSIMLINVIRLCFLCFDI